MGFFDEYYSPYGAKNQIRSSDTRGALSDHERRLRSAKRVRADVVAQLALQRSEATEAYEQLRLITNALISLLEKKGLLKRDELELLMQQLDLLDGFEDRRQTEIAWEQAPRCDHCQHFINPSRRRCVYCGHRLKVRGTEGGPYRGGQALASKAPTEPRISLCSTCSKKAEQHTMRFSDEGVLVCPDCERDRRLSEAKT